MYTPHTLLQVIYIYIHTLLQAFITKSVILMECLQRRHMIRISHSQFDHIQQILNKKYWGQTRLHYMVKTNKTVFLTFFFCLSNTFLLFHTPSPTHSFPTLIFFTSTSHISTALRRFEVIYKNKQTMCLPQRVLYELQCSITTSLNMQYLSTGKIQLQQ